MALSDVSNILWRERQLLELLVFKLEEEQLVLAAGRSRWLAHATREVENVLAEIKRIELERAVPVADAGRELGLSGSPTLRELAGAHPVAVGRHLRRTPPRAARRSRRRSTRSRSRTASCCSAGTRPRAKRSRRWARSTSTRTTRTARCPTARSHSGSSTRRSDVRLLGAPSRADRAASAAAGRRRRRAERREREHRRATRAKPSTS